MKSQALQEMIKKIFSDEQSRHQFETDPGSVISQYALTEQEKRAVLNTQTRLGLVTSDSAQLEAALDPNVIWSAPIP